MTLTLACGLAVEGDDEGEAWPAELCTVVDPLWLLLGRSTSLSAAGDGLGWSDGDALLTVSAFTVVTLDTSMTTGGDKRREPEFRFCRF